jgi:hypothetical protein
LEGAGCSTKGPAILRPSSLRWMRKVGEYGPEIKFIASASLLTLLKTLSFELTSVNIVCRGLIAFLLYAQLEREGYEASATWEALLDGTAGTTNNNLKSLVLKSKVNPPLCDMNGRYMHRRIEIICQVLFGDLHVVPFANGTFLTRYSSMDNNLSRVEIVQSNRLRLMMICRKNSLNSSACFTQRKRHAGAMSACPVSRLVLLTRCGGGQQLLK